MYKILFVLLYTCIRQCHLKVCDIVSYFVTFCDCWWWLKTFCDTISRYMTFYINIISNYTSPSFRVLIYARVFERPGACWRNRIQKLLFRSQARCHWAIKAALDITWKPSIFGKHLPIKYPDIARQRKMADNLYRVYEDNWETLYDIVPEHWSSDAWVIYYIRWDSNWWLINIDGIAVSGI